jgi:hypothetical protein
MLWQMTGSSRVLQEEIEMVKEPMEEKAWSGSRIGILFAQGGVFISHISSMAIVAPLSESEFFSGSE